jgi:drug/metabolite transporter (DMT)-like permease
MSVLALLMAAGLAIVLGRLLVRRLGSLTQPGRALALGILLLALALALGSLAHLRGPRVGATESPREQGALALLVLSLAAVGYRWTSERLKGQGSLPRPMRERRRALPPPPTNGVPPG